MVPHVIKVKLVSDGVSEHSTCESKECWVFNMWSNEVVGRGS